MRHVSLRATVLQWPSLLLVSGLKRLWALSLMLIQTGTWICKVPGNGLLAWIKLAFLSWTTHPGDFAGSKGNYWWPTPDLARVPSPPDGKRSSFEIIYWCKQIPGIAFGRPSPSCQWDWYTQVLLNITQDSSRTQYHHLKMFRGGLTRTGTSLNTSSCQRWNWSQRLESLRANDNISLNLKKRNPENTPVGEKATERHVAQVMLAKAANPQMPLWIILWLGQ